MSASTISPPVSPLAAPPGSSETIAAGLRAPSRPVLASLKERVTRASMWTTIAYLATQPLRLINTLILTRLLIPHEVGLMMMVSVFLLGLQMFSDIGTGPSIIHNKRGDQVDFLNTAWTLQVIRGFGLWLAACAGAWPMSVWYDEPALLWLIPIAGFGVVISGFNSTALISLNRELRLRSLTAIEIGDQIITMVATFVFAIYSPTVWALVVGTYAGMIFRLIASHCLMREYRNRFAWNRADAREMFHFGRWIFFSTALTFFVGQADKFLLGKLMGTTALAVYGYAFVMATLPTQFVKKIGGQVMFPTLAEIARERPDDFYRRMRLMRMVLVGVSMLALLPMMLFGDKLMEFLYPPEWHDSGWMLQILAVGIMGSAVVCTYGNAMIALGKPFLPMFLMMTQLVLMLTASLLGYHWNGEKGFVIGIALVEWLNYPVLVVIMIRQRLWQPEVDLPALLVSGTAVISAHYLL